MCWLDRSLRRAARTRRRSDRAAGSGWRSWRSRIPASPTTSSRCTPDGVVKDVRTTGKDIKRYLDNPVPENAITIKRRTPTPGDKVLFPKGHGTYIEVKLPKQYIDPSTQTMKPITAYTDIKDYPSLMKSPLFDNINVTLNGKTAPSGKNFPKDDYFPTLNVEFGWGTVRVLRSLAKIADGLRRECGCALEWALSVPAPSWRLWEDAA